MIVIEGADLVGKTTLTVALVKRLHAIGHAVVPGHMMKPPSTFDFYWGYRNLISPHSVIDRFHMSQLVYRHSLGEACYLTPHRYELVDAAIDQVGGIVVVMLCRDELLKRRWLETRKPEEVGTEQASNSEQFGRKKMMFSYEQLATINENYRQIAKHKALDVRRPGPTRESTPETATYRCKVDVVLDNPHWSLDACVSIVMNTWLIRQQEHQEVLAGAARAGRIQL